MGAGKGWEVFWILTCLASKTSKTHASPANNYRVGWVWIKDTLNVGPYDYAVRGIFYAENGFRTISKSYLKFLTKYVMIMIINVSNNCTFREEHMK